MSSEALAIALHHSRAKGTAKIVLIGIANHDGDGGSWPSIQTLAKYANVDTRNVQRAIDSLERLGEVRRIENGGGTAHTPHSIRPNLYHFLLQCPPTCDRSRNHRDTRRSARSVPQYLLMDPVAQTPPPGESVTPPGGDSATGPLAQTPPEPDINNSLEPYSALEATVRAREEAESERSAPSSFEPQPVVVPCPSRRFMPCTYHDGKCIDCGLTPAELDARNAA